MSDFDKLKDDAEQEVKDHPQQVHEAEQDAEHALESKFDPGAQNGQGGQQDGQGQQGQADEGNRDASQQGQDQNQGQGQ